jgi:hypothetical protein
MIFYVARNAAGARCLEGTQADAAKVNRVFVQLDIPTDKAGLRDFVQDLFDQIDGGGCALPVAVPVTAPAPAPAPHHAAQAVALEDAWERLSLAEQLHFAALAMERARRMLPAD